MQKIWSLMVAVALNIILNDYHIFSLLGMILFFFFSNICWSWYQDNWMLKWRYKKIRSLMFAATRSNYPMPLTFLKSRKPAESKHFSKGKTSKQEKGKEKEGNEKSETECKVFYFCITCANKDFVYIFISLNELLLQFWMWESWVCTNEYFV